MHAVQAVLSVVVVHTKRDSQSGLDLSNREVRSCQNSSQHLRRHYKTSNQLEHYTVAFSVLGDHGAAPHEACIGLA